MDISTIPTKQYRSHKIVSAALILAVQPFFAHHNGPPIEHRIDFEGGVSVSMPESAFIGKPKPAAGWWLIIYSDGYTSFSPGDKFEEGYTLLDDADKPEYPGKTLVLESGQTIRLSRERKHFGEVVGLGGEVRLMLTVGNTLDTPIMDDETMLANLKDLFERHMAAWMAVDAPDQESSQTFKLTHALRGMVRKADDAGWHASETQEARDLLGEVTAATGGKAAPSVSDDSMPPDSVPDETSQQPAGNLPVALGDPKALNIPLADGRIASLPMSDENVAAAHDSAKVGEFSRAAGQIPPSSEARAEEPMEDAGGAGAVAASEEVRLAGHPAGDGTDTQISSGWDQSLDDGSREGDKDDSGDKKTSHDKSGSDKPTEAEPGTQKGDHGDK